jgi:hypothetical protein
MLAGARMAELVDSIVNNDLRHKIVLFEGKILDGRNRFKACQLAGRKLDPDKDFEPFEGDWDAAVKFVTDENLVRRDLTSPQRAQAADKLAEMAKGRPSKNTAPAVFSQADAAALMGTSVDSVQRARQVRERGVPELAAAVENSEIGLKPAAALARLPEDEQRAALAGGREQVREAVARARPLVRHDQPIENELRRNKSGSALLSKLMVAIKVVEEGAQQLASGRAVIPEGQRDLAIRAVERLRTGSEWILALARGSGVSDDALSAWLSEGEDA